MIIGSFYILGGIVWNCCFHRLKMVVTITCVWFKLKWREREWERELSSQIQVLANRILIVKRGPAIYKTKCVAVACVAQLAGVESCEVEGCRFNSLMGHMPRLQVPSLVQAWTRGNWSMFFPLPSSFAKNNEKMSSGEDKSKLQNITKHVLAIGSMIMQY